MKTLIELPLPYKYKKVFVAGSSFLSGDISVSYNINNPLVNWLESI